MLLKWLLLLMLLLLLLLLLLLMLLLLAWVSFVCTSTPLLCVLPFLWLCLMNALLLLCAFLF